MLNKLVLATIIAAAVSLGCILVGGLLGATHIEVAAIIGSFLKTYNLALAILAGLWYFFTR